MINEERGMFRTEKVMQVMVNVLVWCGVLTRMGSVLELLEKVLSIHHYLLKTGGESG